MRITHICAQVTDHVDLSKLGWKEQGHNLLFKKLATGELRAIPVGPAAFVWVMPPLGDKDMECGEALKLFKKLEKEIDSATSDN
jgi:hypothetical protein